MPSLPPTPEQVQDTIQKINRMQRSGMIIRNIDLHGRYQDFAQIIKGLLVQVTPRASIEGRAPVQFNPVHPGRERGHPATLLLKAKVIDALTQRAGTPARAAALWKLLSQPAVDGQAPPTLETFIAALQAGPADCQADAAALEALRQSVAPFLDGVGLMPAPRAVMNYDLTRTPPQLKDAARLMLYHQIIEESRQRQHPVALIDQRDPEIAEVQAQLQSGGNLHVHLY